MKIRWIQVCFLLTALPQFTEAETVKPLTAKYGEDITLPCENSGKPENDCGYTTWNFSSKKGWVELITEGNISEDVGAKKSRLRLTEDCSLVINNVQEEDAGRYECSQVMCEEVHLADFHFNLSVSAGEKTGPATTEPTTAERVTTAEISTTATTCDAPTPNTRLLDVIMLTLHVFGVLLLTVITVLLFRAQVKRGSSAGNTERDGDDCTEIYEDVGESSAVKHRHQVQALLHQLSETLLSTDMNTI